MKTLFDFIDYREYLLHRYEEIYGHTKGYITKLAEAAMAQPPYMTRIMKGRTDLSVEQAAYLNSFLRHSEDEGVFFLLLVQWARAGTSEVKKIIEKQMLAYQEKQTRLSQKVASQEAPQQMGIIFRKWNHLAILSVLSIPSVRSPQDIADYLGTSLEQVMDSLVLLEKLELIEKHKKFYKLKCRKIYLGNDSPDISAHHISWRLKSIDTLQRRKPISGEFYSSVVSLSRSDYKKVKNLFADCTKQAKEIIAKSPEEIVVALNWDLFELDVR